MAEGVNSRTYRFQISPREGEKGRSGENLTTISEIEAYTGLSWDVIRGFGTSFPAWGGGEGKNMWHTSRTAIDIWFIETALAGGPS